MLCPFSFSLHKKQALYFQTYLKSIMEIKSLSCALFSYLYAFFKYLSYSNPFITLSPWIYHNTVIVYL